MIREIFAGMTDAPPVPHSHTAASIGAGLISSITAAVAAVPWLSQVASGLIVTGGGLVLSALLNEFKTQRAYSKALHKSGLVAKVSDFQARLEQLEAENARLKAELATARKAATEP